MVWTNAPLVVYHGTDRISADNILLTDISLALCNSKTDFGPGFYVTSSLIEARFWADWRAHTTSDRAVVMAFDLNCDRVASVAEHLVFIRPDDSFHDFVEYNRRGNLTHARARSYDVVYGPVSKYPDRVHVTDWDQICFLHPNSLQYLENKRIYDAPPRGYFTFP